MRKIDSFTIDILNPKSNSHLTLVWVGNHHSLRENMLEVGLHALSIVYAEVSQIGEGKAFGRDRAIQVLNLGTSQPRLK